MDRCYHLIMSKYSNLLWLIYWHFLPSASIFFTVLVYFLRRIISTFTQLYKLFFPTPNSIFSTCRRHRTTLHTPLSGGWEDSFIKCRVYFVIFKFPTHRWEYNPEHNCKYFIYHILTILHKTGQNLYIHFFSYTVQFPLSIWICVSLFYQTIRWVNFIMTTYSKLLKPEDCSFTRWPFCTWCCCKFYMRFYLNLLSCTHINSFPNIIFSTCRGHRHGPHSTPA